MGRESAYRISSNAGNGCFVESKTFSAFSSRFDAFSGFCIICQAALILLCVFVLFGVLFPDYESPMATGSA
jgi:hypothetical protein